MGSINGNNGYSVPEEAPLSRLVNQALVIVLPDGRIRAAGTYFKERYNIIENWYNFSIYDLAATNDDINKLKFIIENSSSVSNFVKPERLNFKTQDGFQELFNVVGTTISFPNEDCALIISSIISFDIIEVLKFYSDRVEITKQINSQLSHEIKNPLSVFNLNLNYFNETVDSLLDNFSNSPSSLELLKSLKLRTFEMSSQVKYIESILKHLSEYSKLISVKLESIHLTQIIEVTIGIMKISSSLKRLKSNQLVIDLEPIKNIFITGNNIWLSQIIWNLLINAYEAIDENGKIYVIGKANDSYIYLRICNIGHLDDNIKEKMFEPYITSKLDNQHQGLGLSIVKNLVTQLKGSIYVNEIFSKILNQTFILLNIRFPRTDNMLESNIALTEADYMTSEELECYI